MKEQLLRCQKCQARKEASRPVPWEINNIESDILFIGRNPGQQEDVEGRPFVGPGGKQLDAFLSIAGIDRNTVNIGNLINCYTTADRVPVLDEIVACYKHLQSYISLLKPKLVITFGETTLTSLTGLKGMTRSEGVFYPHRWGFTVFPCIHPGATLYQRSKYWPMLVKEANILKEYIRSKQ